MANWKQIITEANKVTDLTAPSSAFAMNSQKITGVANPTSNQDAATKAYVDSAVEADTVRAVTAGGNTLATSETLAFTAGSNVTITENAGAVTIAAANDNDNDDVSVANLKTRLAGGFGSNAVQIGDSSDVVTIGHNLVVTGDLTISGTTITTATETLEIADNTLVLNSDLTGSAVDTGFVFERGNSGDNKTFYFDTSANKMILGDNSSAAIGGTYQADMMTIRIDGAAINTSSTEVAIGHMQYHNGDLYVRVED